tara:strand:- start:17 stop:277 length:261 start_codon:yes stop_codon:yes gene_type:complete
MKDKSKKAKVTAEGDKIEFCLGDAGNTKYEIMTAIAKHHTIYGATVWLNTPLPEHEGKTPANLMLEGNLQTVIDLIKEFKSEGRNK